MIRLIGLLLLMVWGSSAAAQTIPVQTGEHADFTRVVLTIPPGADWRVGRIDNGYGIEIPGVDGFDLTGFFDIIPRDRIASVAVDQDVLALTLACDCRAMPFTERAGILVIDVRDGPAPTDAETEIALFPEASALVGIPDQPVPEFDLIKLPVSALPTPPVRLPAPDVLRQETEQRQNLNTLQSEIAQSLSRAASQGLLDLRDDLAPNAAQATPVGMPGPAPDAPPSLVDARQPGITARSSVDIGRGEALIAQNVVAQLMACWPDAHVDVSDWGDDRPFSDQIADARQAISGEFDRSDPDAVLALARLYLHFGFGREARQVLNIDGGNSQARRAVVTLAQIIDGDSLSDASILTQHDCPNKVALWSVLSLPKDQVPDHIDGRQIAMAFRQMPDALQPHLRPRLAERLLDLDAGGLAESVMTTGPKTERSADTAVTQSAIAEDRGDLPAAAEVLEQLSQDGARMTPDAVVRLIDVQIVQENPVSPDTIALAQTLAFENKGSLAEPDLARVIVAGQLQNEQHGLAWAALANFEPVLPATVHSELRNAIAAAATKSADEVTFLSIAFSGLDDSLLPDTQNDLARRLLNIGFPERAVAVIRGATQGSAMAERRYLRAEAAVRMGDFSLAEAHLAGITSERAQKILSFGPDGVPLLHLEITATNQLPEIATQWRNGDWTALEQGDDGLLNDVSALVLNGPPPNLDPQAPLAAGRAMVAEANAARATIDAMMNRFDAPLLARDSP